MADDTALDITAGEIRQRLKGLTSADVSDTVAGDASHKLAADAWAEAILAKNTTSVALLEDYQAALLKAAKLDYVALRIVTAALTGEFRAGVFSGKGPSAGDMQIMVDTLKTLIQDTCDAAGLAVTDMPVSSSGEDDYMPDGKDATMIDLSESDVEHPFNLWST